MPGRCHELELRLDVESLACCREPGHAGDCCGHFVRFIKPGDPPGTVRLRYGALIVCERRQ